MDHDIFFSLEGSNVILFENEFGSVLRNRIFQNVSNFLQALRTFLRPIDCCVRPNMCHQWGDIYFYKHATIIRIYGFLGRRNVLPRYVPLRIRFLEVTRQISILQDTDFPPKKARNENFFPDLTIFHNFSIMKEGGDQLVHFLRPYNMEVISKRLNDIEGFYARLIRKINLNPRGAHEFNFSKDIIINNEYLESQKRKKIGWHIYQDMLSEIHEQDPNYDPLSNFKSLEHRLRLIFNNFIEIYGTMNEKLGKRKKTKIIVVDN